MLAEGWPCLPEPYKDSSSVRPSKLFTESARVEAVFRKYCHRDTDGKKKDKAECDIAVAESKEAEAPGVASCAADTAPQTNEEEYIVLICHQHIIRYFVCRALQLHPEAWLRFRGSNCGITEIIISDDGRVSLEKFADVGHLPVNHHTFH
jgi:serine/threonine-protein phosphatase PGAM5